MHKSWKFWAAMVGVGLLAIVINTKTKNKVGAFLSGLPVVGPFLS